MAKTIELPLWLFVLILLFAAVTFASHFLLPSVRWFFRRRLERAVARINQRLERPIEPFKLARRHDMIQRLIYDPQVAEAIAEHARAEGVPENVAFEKARRYAREIVPSFSASAYFGFAIKAARWLSTALYRVRMGHVDAQALGAIDPEATLVFVMNHRSNMDYVLVTYLAADRSALSYAVGEWARGWPLQPLIRAMGGYFIRRKSRNALYRRVLARYVQMATQGGVTQAVFPEGGLSLDGRVGPARLGLLSYILSDFTPGAGRDVVFVPVALNYDRVLEDRVLIRAGDEGARRFRFSLWSVLGFLMHQLGLRLRGRFHRFGYAAVSFGAPLSLSGWLGGHAGADPEALGEELMGRIRAVLPVLPVPLVATVLLRAGRPLSEAEVAEGITALLGELDAHHAHTHLPRGDVGYAAQVGLRMLRMRHMVQDGPGETTQITPAERPALDYYAASIAHLLDAPAA